VGHGSKQEGLGIQVIGGMKLASALLLAAAGFGLFGLLRGDVGSGVARLAGQLHLDPNERAIHDAIALVARIDRKDLETVGLGSFVYAALHLVEGTGLLLRRTWAEYLTVVITGSLLPIEVYEIARKATALRIGILLVNLAIVAYLVAQIRLGRRSRAGASPAPRPAVERAPGAAG
jgi:uncharacterized membrane protein (DUF2068 family)